MKYIAYKIPFQSYQGVDYEVRIYAETDAQVAPAAVVLYGGEQPFVTEENDSDDIFEPVRHQTGTIQMVDNAGTGELAGLLEKLCPENNISNPVQLVEKNGANESVIWQGFLNCESYSQDYVGIPQSIELPVNSVLGAMGSVYLDVETFDGLMTVRECLIKMLDRMQEVYPIHIGKLHFSKESIEFLGKYIDTTVKYDKKEIDCAYYHYTIAEGSSYKDMLNAIASFMGWTIREVGQDIYFQRVMGGDAYYGVDYFVFPDDDWEDWLDVESVAEIDMPEEDDAYRSIEHTRDVRQGARSVYIGAKVDDYELELELPECPVDDVVEYHEVFNAYDIFLILNKDMEFYDHIKYGFCKADVVAYTQIPGYASRYGGISVDYDDVTDMMDVFDSSVFSMHGDAPSHQYNIHPREYTTMSAGAWLAKVAMGVYPDDPPAWMDYKDCLYCCFLPGLTNGISGHGFAHPDDNRPIFGMRSVVPFRPSYHGYLNIQGMFAGFFFTTANFSEQADDVFQLRLSIGNKYWNGNAWVDNGNSYFPAEIDGDKIKKDWTEQTPIEEVDGMLIPVDDYLHGVVTLEIMSNAGYPATDDLNPICICEAFISELRVDYIPLDKPIYSDREENGYYRLLGGNFSEDKEIGLEYASWARNNPSPTIVLNDLEEVMTTMLYHYPGGDKEYIPEIDLLNRAAKFYKKVRRHIELDMPHIATLPMKRINGLDGHKYLPMAHSRNYVSGIERIMMIEDINGDE